MNNLPFDKPGRFWKGNLHCHSNLTDGALSPADVCRTYAENGYDFISLTDHFLAVYDYPLVDTRPYRTERFTMILGAELHHGQTEHGVMWHILANGLPLDFAPPAETETVADFVERAIDAGAFVSIAHPQWYTLTVADALSLGDRVHAIEVYNTTCDETDTGAGSYMLDLLLARGKWYNAIATDDAHFRPGRNDGLQNFVMVKAEANEPEALLAALKAGYFYASQGPLIHDIQVVPGDKVVLRTSPISTAILRNTSPKRPSPGMSVAGGSCSVRQIGNGMTEVELPLESVTGDWARLIVKDHFGRRAWSNPFKLEA
ncbi:MAG: CehA/McbA family metallohydrolase [Anaerolineales bacterium]|nr:CehA/McbA family metallohydrolase [Anaerolineales bacterium]